MLSLSDFKAKYNYTTASKMTRQYLDIKFEHQSTMLFFRVGDFYELFFEDAIEASRLLGITLTSRSKGGEKIPMCGVPHHALDSYLNKLVDNGLRVAICEQLESPEEAKKRGNQEIVRREVVQIVTQGTITEESILDTERSNYLVSVIGEGEIFAIAYLDLSTFEFGVMELPHTEVISELTRLAPKEILAPKALTGSAIFVSLTKQPEEFFDNVNVNINRHSNENLTPLQQLATSTIISYINLTQKRNLISLQAPEVY